MSTLELEAKRKIRLQYFVKNHPRINVRFDDVEELDALETTDKATFVFNRPINDLPDINAFFKKINSRMENDSVFKGFFSDCTNPSNYKKGIYAVPVVGKAARITEFIVHRVIPKTKGLDRLYFSVTKGTNRRLSKAEVLGRLVYCGFEIIGTAVTEGVTHFTVRKAGDPLEATSVSGGWIYRMPRVGMNGKIIHVYKFRTMHPYSEFLQDYLKKENGYGANGKISDDFRMTSWGKFMRKYWLDEVPQLINVIKGDMKLVGVRPISMSYFRDIPKDLQDLRIRQKPGCIPPYVAMNRASSVSSVLSAEKEYLETKSRNPITTDLKYLFWAVYNIIVKKKRSA
jgi:lipopolysaccharide/colanic/teichoic acid biosynthesis glycosyltransferase